VNLVIHVGRNASIARFILTFGTSNHLDIPSDSLLEVGFCDSAPVSAMNFAIAFFRFLISA
jgi:hypothetical protein